MLSLKTLFVLLSVIVALTAANPRASDAESHPGFSILGERVVIEDGFEATRSLEKRSAPTCGFTLKTPSPRDFVCGAQGALTKPNPIQTTPLSNQEDCLNSCEATKSCISFSYATRNAICMQNARPIKRSNFLYSKTGVRFWNRHCYTYACGLCPSGQTDCDDSCVDLDSDPNNCGTCGNMCTANGTTCSFGQCQCTTDGQQVCGDACTDTQTDTNNCGSCGTMCTGSEVCGGGICQNAPPVVLSNPIPINDVENGKTTTNEDDVFFNVNLPFNVTFYNVSSSSIWISINSYIGLTPPPSSNFSDYSNQPLPYADGSFPDTGIMAFWDDLYLYAGTPQGLYFEVDGDEPSQNVTFEWYTSHYLNSTAYYHFTMQLFEDQPNNVTFTYYQISDSGSSGTVGAKSISQNISSQYSYDQTVITDGLQLTFDSTANTFS